MMSSQNPDPIPPVNPQPDQAAPAGAAQENQPQPTYRDWREQRRAERWARHEARWQRRAGRHTGWFAGILLIGLGIILLLVQLNIPLVANWWALFILIPALWSFVAAWDAFQDASRLTRRGAWALTVGVLLTFLSFIFLFDLVASLYWPVLLIVGGVALVGISFLPE
jgi:ABC-type multidrug transport system fused ATPase/permease subunit